MVNSIYQMNPFIIVIQYPQRQRHMYIVYLLPYFIKTEQSFYKYWGAWNYMNFVYININFLKTLHYNQNLYNQWFGVEKNAFRD